MTGTHAAPLIALPGLHAAEHDIVAAGKPLTVRYAVEATHPGNLLGATRPADGFTGTMSTPAA